MVGNPVSEIGLAANLRVARHAAEMLKLKHLLPFETHAPMLERTGWDQAGELSEVVNEDDVPG